MIKQSSVDHFFSDLYISSQQHKLSVHSGISALAEILKDHFI